MVKKIWNDGIQLYHLSLWSARVVIVLLSVILVACYNQMLTTTFTLVSATILIVLFHIIRAIHRRAWSLLFKGHLNEKD
jgi:amino acid transporter